MVTITLRVLSRPDVEHLSKIYQSLGQDYDERVLPSIGNEVLKSIVAQFDAAELITQREVVSSRIRADLLQRAGEFNIKLEDVSITHLTFGKVKSFPNQIGISCSHVRPGIHSSSRGKANCSTGYEPRFSTYVAHTTKPACNLDAERARFIVEKVRTPRFLIQYMPSDNLDNLGTTREASGRHSC